MVTINEKPAKSFIETAHCDGCGAELVRDDQTMQLTHPPRLGYVCPACGAKEMLNDFYPRVVAESFSRLHSITQGDQIITAAHFDCSLDLIGFGSIAPRH